MNNLYSTTEVNQAKKHILASIPVGHKNQILGLLQILENSIIKEQTNARNNSKQNG